MNKIEAAKLNDDEKDAECARLMALVEQDDAEAIDLVMSIIRDKSHPLVSCRRSSRPCLNGSVAAGGSRSRDPS